MTFIIMSVARSVAGRSAAWAFFKTNFNELNKKLKVSKTLQFFLILNQLYIGGFYSPPSLRA